MSENPIVRAALRLNASEPNVDQGQTIQIADDDRNNNDFDLTHQQRTTNLLIERCNNQKGMMLMAFLRGLLRRSYMQLHPDERQLPFEVKMADQAVIVERANREQISINVSTPETLGSLVKRLGCFKVPLTLEALRVAVLEYDWPPAHVLAFAGERPDVPTYLEVVGYDYDEVLAYDAQSRLDVHSRESLFEEMVAQSYAFDD